MKEKEFIWEKLPTKEEETNKLAEKAGETVDLIHRNREIQKEEI